MRILCDRRLLLDNAAIVSAAVATKSPKPILQNVLLRAGEGSLSLFATDLEIAITTRIDQVKVDQPGECLVPIREFMAVLREIPEPTVALHAADQKCRIETPRGTFQLVGGDVRQFPSGFERPPGEPVRLPASSFVDLVRRTGFAVAKEATRYAMNGVLCQAQADMLRMVGTDGRRLALAYRTIDLGKKASPFSCIVPVKALAAVVQALSLPWIEGPTADGAGGSRPEAEAGARGAAAAPAEGKAGGESTGGKEKPGRKAAAAPVTSGPMVELRAGSSMIAFASGGTEVFARLIDGDFPAFDTVIPKSCETTVEIDRSRLESLVRMVAIFEQSETHAVRMTLAGGTLKFDSEAANVGSADVRMDVDMKGPGGNALYNPDYVLEFLKVTPCQTLRLEFSDDSSPAKFVPEEQFIYILMPITGS